MRLLCWIMDIVQMISDAVDVGLYQGAEVEYACQFFFGVFGIYYIIFHIVIFDIMKL